MSLQEVISSGVLETYVLGTASKQEIAMIQDLCKKYPELVIEIERIELALINFASQNSTKLDSNLKNKIEQQLVFEKQNVVSLYQQKTVPNLYKYGIAASVVLLALSTTYIVVQQNKLKNITAELGNTASSNTNLNSILKSKQDSLILLSNHFSIISNPKTKTIALNGMNSLISKSALIHWNTQTNEVYFNASALPKNNPNQQYQLWAIVDGKPLDAGVIDLNDVTVFQKMKSIKNAQAFAVTIESIGGSITPTLETMCLLGNV